MGPLSATLGDLCATAGGLVDLAKPMSLAMEGMGESMRSARGKQSSEYASSSLERSLGVLMDRNLALADAVDAMYPGNATDDESSS
jgi:hypothetical protein